jgi:hypothetical protein
MKRVRCQSFTLVLQLNFYEFKKFSGFSAGAGGKIYVPAEISTPLCRLTGGIYNILATEYDN